MENKEYLTIKEFSRIAEVTPQSVYQRLDTTLKPYLNIVKGKKYLNIKALKELYNIDIKQDSQQFNQETKQDSKENKQGITVDEVTQQILQDYVNTLKLQLEEKDKQIQELLNKMDQEQKLHAMAQQKILELEEKKVDVEESPQKKEPKVSIWKKIFNN